MQCSHATEKEISIQSTPDLQSITSNWVATFAGMHPETGIEMIRPSGPVMEGDLLSGADLTFVSQVYADQFGDAGWKMVVGYDAIVPVINAKNPSLETLRKQGVSSIELANLFSHQGKLAWGVLYSQNDPSIRSQLAQFLGTDKGLDAGIRVGSARELIAAIQKDPNGVGFCRLSDLIEAGQQSMPLNIALLPIDKNKNGHLDSFENIYGTLDDFSRGIWIGKYPKALKGTIYALSAEAPSLESEAAFLQWVITGGQQYLNPTGTISELAATDRQVKKLAMLSLLVPQAGATTGTGFLAGRLQGLSTFSFILILLIPIILAFMIWEAVVRHRREKSAGRSPHAESLPVLDTNAMEVPGGLYFDKSHTWAFLEKNGAVRVGIDDFLQHITGPLTRIKTSRIGDKVKKGDPLFTVIQKGKQLTIHAPVSGTIKSVNTLLDTDPSLINTSPYVDGWVCMIEPTNWARELSLLFMGDKYREWLKSEFTRFKDFLAETLQSSKVEYAQVILQDGGEVKDGVLANLGPEVWEDFQNTFIDTAK